MKTRFVTCAALSATFGSGLSAPPPAPKVVEAQRRMDLTGSGSFHRIGMLREMQNTRRNAEKAAQAAAAKKAGATKS